ncbi:MAG: hypothetical protein HY865_18605 [Chloroflexi bacterium]|nr:hypothetical protein [Chloroflexota bacterium]
MWRTTKSKAELFVRVILTIIVLFNAIIPIPAMAKPFASVETLTSQPEGESTPLPDAEPVYYQPSVPIPNPSRFSPQADEKKPETPEKDAVEFSISTSKGEVGGNRSIVVNVAIRNNSETQIDNLAYYDKLEAGLGFDSSSDKRVVYKTAGNAVSYKVGSLAAGEEVVFSYTLKVKNKKAGKLSIHNAEIEYELDGEMHAQTASLGFADSSAVVDADALIVVPDQAGDGWGTAGRYSLYLGEEVLSQEAVVSITPADVSEAGPELQFDLELIQTTDPSTSGGELREQDVTLGSVVETDFESPAYLEINLDGVADLEKIPAGQEPYVATYDEEHDIWVKVPIVETDPATNSVTVEAAHFSTWGAGLGNSLPQNGANVLLFDQPYTSLFTGASRYSVPIWTPPGRAGMSPDISLSYSSATVDGVLGDVQAPWVGVGWNIDGVEIVRKIVTDENGYGYSNDFALTLNGTVYELVVDTDDEDQSHYYTKQSSFLYIERHNKALGNDEGVDNTTGEWWEVVTTDGTSYRLGWDDNKEDPDSSHSEQLALMYGYSCKNANPCTTPDGPYQILGYAGVADNLVAMRWRVDRITDTHGNYISYTYSEEQPDGAAIAPFDRESYLSAISYTGFDGDTGDLGPGYEVKFVSAPRSEIGDVPVTFNLWDNLDSKYLNRIEIKCLECNSSDQITRTYDLEYSLALVPNDNGTLTLTGIKISGERKNGETVIESLDAPDIKFTYQNLDNRAATGTNKKYTYPRLQTLNNGTGGVLTYTYENDGRGTNSWYNYHVKNVHVYGGRGTSALQAYSYETPVYTGVGSDETLGELVGYTTVSEEQLDYNNNNAVLLETKHTFGTEGLDTGKELITEWLDDTTVLKKTANTYVTDNSKAPFPGWNYRYLYRTINSVESYGNLTVSSQVTYVHDPATGNLLLQTEYLGTAPYRKTYYEYVDPADYDFYILDSVSRVWAEDASGNPISETRYGYNNYGDPILTQRLTGKGNETVDSGAVYDLYGNVITSLQYTESGHAGTDPTGGNALVTSTDYSKDDHEGFYTYPYVQTNPLGQSTTTEYLYALGVPYQVKDLNGWITTTEYDLLGRQRSITVPGIEEDKAVVYNYPEPNSNGVIDAPYSVEMQILDTAGGKNYRSVWGIYDGLGRQIQMQVFDSDEDRVLVTNTEFNAQGAVSRQSSPYYASDSQGRHISPVWTQFTSSEYDALGRAIKVTQPGDLVTRTEYDGFLTTAFDPNGQKIERGTDGMGRLAYVREFSDVNTVYAVTRYSYDQLDHLTTVTDAKNNLTTLDYDWLGRKTKMVDPDMGEWLYEYYPTGTLSKQTDARGTVLTFTYDELNRMKKKYADGVELASYEYGADKGENIGMRTLMSDGSGSARWTYANYGRTVTETREIGGVSRTLVSESDWLGRPLEVANLAAPEVTPDPNKEVLNYTYDALGRPESLKSTWNSSISLVDLTYNVLGQVDTHKLGVQQPSGASMVEINNQYDPDDNRLSSRTAKTAAVATPDLMNFAYTYDDAGNILTITDGLGDINETHTFTYDFLNRLTAARANTTGNASDVKYDQYFTYDQVGNITQMNDWVIPEMAMQRGPAPFAGIPSASQKDSLSSGIGVSAVSYRSPGFGFSGSASLALQNGDTPTPTSTPTSGLIFADGFESNDFSLWSSSTTDSGDLSVSPSAALEGTYGMQAVIDDTTAIYAVNHSPVGEQVYRVRFQFDPNSVVIPVDQGFSILYTSCASGSGYRLMLSDNTSSGYDLQLQARSDAATWIGGGYAEISDDVHVIEVELVTASAAGANDGTLTLWVDDTQVDALTGLDNDTRLIESAYFGIDSVDTGTSGTIYYDGFESYRTLRATSPTPTDTPTPTSTPAVTFTPTPTATFTPTNTPVPTNTPAFTSTPSWPDADAYTSAMLHMDGVDTSTNFVDQTGKSWVVGGNAQVDNFHKKFGNGSALFDGSGDYIYTANHTSFDFGSGDFTIEAWVRFNSIATTQVIFDKRSASYNYPSFMLGYSASSHQWFFNSSKNGTSYAVTLAGGTAAANTWYHVAAVRSGDVWKLYVDGQPVSSATVSGAVVLNSGNVFIGAQGVGTNSFNGWLDEVRISKGVARWTAAFTPPSSPYEMELTPAVTPTPTQTSTPTRTPTVPAVAMGGYWSFDVTGTPSNTVVDIAPTGTPNNATLYGGVVVNIPGASGQAVSFDGDDDYAYVTHHAELINNGSFTVSAWVKPSSIVTNHIQYIVHKGGTYKDYGLVVASTYGTATPTANLGNTDFNGSVAFQVGDLSPSMLYGPILPVNRWTMVTGVYDKDANQTRLYLDGKLVAVQEVTGAVSMSAGGLLFGSDAAGTYAYNGSLDEVRFYKYALTDTEVLTLFGVFSTPTPLPMTATPTPTLATPNITPIPSDERSWGTGNDGDLSVQSGATFNINVDTNGHNGRTCADGVAYNVTLLGAMSADVDSPVNPTATPTPTSAATATATPTSTTTPVSMPLSSCLAAGDEVLLMRLSGGSAISYNSGSYEFLRVASVNDNSVTFTTPKTKWYGSGWRNDLNIGTGANQYRVMLMRVPNYHNVTVGTNGTLNATAYDNKKYGVVAFRVSGLLNGSGTISADWLGYKGSSGYGKGGNATVTSGGGGGYGTKGTRATGATGGISYGSPQLDILFFGSGGGTGKGSEVTYAGGKGGGAILLFGKDIAFEGTISANGSSNGTAGGGSGGSVRIEGEDIDLNAITAIGGTRGGDGRIAIYYSTVPTVTSSDPEFYDPAELSATPVPASTLWGTGADGDLEVPAETTFNISTDVSNIHTCADGGDGVSYKVTALGDSYAQISVISTVTPLPLPDANCLRPGDEVLLLHNLGSGPNIGKYEFLRVGGVVGDRVYFTTSKVNFYGTNADDDSNIGMTIDDQRVILQRVPNYANVEINGTLKTNNRLLFRVWGVLNGIGTIHANETGYASATGYGKGGNGTQGFGGGGGYGADGYGVYGGSAGSSYGSLQLDTLFPGSGGGTGSTQENTYGGGAGGGIIGIFADDIDFTGSIAANGGIGGGTGPRGGGGSGGGVRLEGDTVKLSAVTVNGGAGGASGAGGYGRIAVYYQTSLESSLVDNNEYIHLEQVDPNATPTPIPTITPIVGFDEYDKVLLEMDGADAFTVFEDKAGKTWNARGNAQIDTEYSKFGGASAKFDGTGDYITTDDSDDFNVGSGDFTVDFWFRKNENGTNQLAFGQLNSTATNGGLYGYTSLTTNVISARFYSNSTLYTLNGTTKVTDTDWHHYAVARDGNYLRLFLDGKLEGTLETTLTITNSSSAFSIGQAGAYAGGNVNGWIDEFRFSKGVARWKAAFTPPTHSYYYDDYVTSTPTPAPTAEWVEKKYTYSTAVPHAVTALTDAETTETLGLYDYDANGNMTCRTEDGVMYKQTYNTENRISSILKIAEGNCDSVTRIAAQWDFAYDGDGTRTATLTTPYDDASGLPISAETKLTVYYFGGSYEVSGAGQVDVEQNGFTFASSPTAVRKYYSFNGQSVAVRSCEAGDCSLITADWSLSYLLTDHLGSTVAVTDSTGALITQQRYLPFGGQRTLSGYQATGLTDFGYTGQRALDEGMGGLMDYNARFYSPTLGRFLQPDTLIPNTQNPQSWNRFSYVRNNPILYNDPTGHNEDCGIGEACQVGHDNPNDPDPIVGSGGWGGGGGNNDDDEDDDDSTSIKEDLDSGGGGAKQAIPAKDDLCPDDALYCVEKSLTKTELHETGSLLSNFQGAYIAAAFFWAVVAGVTAAAAVVASGTIVGIPAGMVLGVISGISAVAAAGFGYEAAALTDLIDYVDDMEKAADNNGGRVSVAYYQQKQDIGPGLVHQFDNDGDGYGFTTLTGLLLVKNQWGIP